MNQKTYANSQELFKLHIRVPKEQSSWVYFQLEANEGLCFYSTLEHEPGELNRDIEIHGPIEWKDACLQLLNSATRSFEWHLLEENTVPDNKAS